jgi:hypothetical protein
MTVHEISWTIMTPDESFHHAPRFEVRQSHRNHDFSMVCRERWKRLDELRRALEAGTPPVSRMVSQYFMMFALLVIKCYKML